MRKFDIFVTRFQQSIWYLVLKIN